MLLVGVEGRKKRIDRPGGTAQHQAASCSDEVDCKVYETLAF
ncbi:hypothetical protein ALC56_07698 [Trachymyrmex septentrionalis]|uniref:Uncharacterized protein n=1 Tax=Trachymyrmex septentrionalis TaxID=34720 RepID=A0A151JVV2_9HYME|nr:hypothetical protein ALC56_07698 [Trachymyrmex septentrionalis]